MNNINSKLSGRQTHEVDHHKINCQISSDLIAYYVMSVRANEYKKGDTLQLQYTGRGGNSRHLRLMTMYVGAVFANHFKYL